MPDDKEWEQHLQTKTGAECGRCGCKLTYSNDAGTGFCKKCQDKEDSEE